MARSSQMITDISGIKTNEVMTISNINDKSRIFSKTGEDDLKIKMSLVLWALAKITDKERNDIRKGLLSLVKSNKISLPSLKGKWWQSKQIAFFFAKTEQSKNGSNRLKILLHKATADVDDLGQLNDEGFIDKLRSGDIPTKAIFLRSWIGIEFTAQKTAQFIFCCLKAQVLFCCWQAVHLLCEKLDKLPSGSRCQLTIKDLQSDLGPIDPQMNIVKTDGEIKIDLREDQISIDEGSALVSDNPKKSPSLPAKRDETMNVVPKRFFSRTIEEKTILPPKANRVLGFVDIRSDFYLFYVVEEWQKGSFVTLDSTAVREDYPKYGAFTLTNVDRKPPKKGGIYVIDFYKDELRENLDPIGNPREDFRYKINYDQLWREKRFRSASEFGIYNVVEPNQDFENLTSVGNISVTLTGSLEDDKQLKVVNEPVLLKHKGVFYGPVTLKQTAFQKFYVNLNAILHRGIIPAWQPGKELAGSSFRMYGSSRQYFIFRTVATLHMVPIYVDLWSDELLLQYWLQSKDKNPQDLWIELAQKQCLDDRDDRAIDQSRLIRVRQALQRAIAREKDRQDVFTYLLKDVFPRNTAVIHAFAEQIAASPELHALFCADSALQQEVKATENELLHVQSELVKAQNEAQDARHAVATQQTKLQHQQQELQETEQKLDAVRESLAQKESRLQFLTDHGLEIKQAIDVGKALSCLQNETRQIEKLRDVAMSALNEAVRKANNFDNDLLPPRILAAANGWNEDLENEKLQLKAQFMAQFCHDPSHHLHKEDLLALLLSRIQAERWYERNFVINLFIVVVQNFFTVLSGEPGIGKTSICRLIAQSLGLTPDCLPVEMTRRFVEIPVEHGWTTKRDLIGYWNPLSNRFETADPDRWQLIRQLDAEARQPEGSCYPALMLLDEANLSPMEYYWSDWMRLCDATGDEQTSVELSLWERSKMRIPGTLRFLATINNDSTTQALSPRLIDRAWVITLPHTSLQSGSPVNKKAKAVDWPIAWQDLLDLFAKPEPLPATANRFLTDLEVKTIPLGIRLSTRSRNQMQRYIGVAAKLFTPSGEAGLREALDYSVLQKILPRINGLGEEFKGNLTSLQAFLKAQGLLNSSHQLQKILDNGAINLDNFAFFR